MAPVEPGKRSIAKEEGTRTGEEDNEPDLIKLSPVGEVLRRATEAGSGVLSIGRPWVRHEGWLLKESGGPMSSYQPRYFVVAGGKLEYYKEESAKVSLKNAEGQSLGVTLQHSNIVTKVEAGLALQQKALQEGDVVLGMNGDPLVQQLLQPAVERARRAGTPSLSFTVLRPKGKIHLAGATVTLGGARKAGGHLLTVSAAAGAAHRARYQLVCATERDSFAWQTSTKEAIAAATMDTIKTTIAQALDEQMYNETLQHLGGTAPPSNKPQVARGSPGASESPTPTDQTVTKL